MVLPVFTGIGHDIDETVLDLVAHTALKTPTAVAEYLIQHNLFFENELLQSAAQIRALAEFQIRLQTLDLNNREMEISLESRQRLLRAGQQLDHWEQALPGLAAGIFKTQTSLLNHAEALCEALSPLRVLQRGYSITTHNGKIVTGKQSVQPGDTLETQLADGVVHSKVQPNV
jgi:exodeoxyribonuclease VII large subunit